MLQLRGVSLCSCHFLISYYVNAHMNACGFLLTYLARVCACVHVCVRICGDVYAKVSE